MSHRSRNSIHKANLCWSPINRQTKKNSMDWSFPGVLDTQAKQLHISKDDKIELDESLNLIETGWPKYEVKKYVDGDRVTYQLVSCVFNNFPIKKLIWKYANTAMVIKVQWNKIVFPVCILQQEYIPVGCVAPASVAIKRGCLSGRCLPRGVHPLPREQNDWQTGVKTWLYHKLRLRAVINLNKYDQSTFQELNLFT